MIGDHATGGRNDGLGGLERKVREADALVRRTVERLSRSCPPELLGTVARDDLFDLVPHLQEALDALACIEKRRSLTEEEQARRRAFKMLLETGR